MRKLILYIATSLDGKIARADHSIDWLPEVNGDDDFGYDQFYAGVDTLLMGYKTYEICRALGPWYYEGKVTYVFSRSQKEVIDQAEIVNDDPVKLTQSLLAKPGGNIWLVGGGELISQLHNAGLIDEYIVTIIPHLVGDGIPLFPNLSKEIPLRATRVQAYDSGVLMGWYERVR